MRLKRAVILLLMVLSLSWTNLMKASMESVLIPVPLFLAACLIVLQMSPGR